MFPGWQVWNDHKNQNKYFSKWYSKVPQNLQFFEFVDLWKFIVNSMLTGREHNDR